jgi:Phage integrase family
MSGMTRTITIAPVRKTLRSRRARPVPSRSSRPGSGCEPAPTRCVLMAISPGELSKLEDEIGRRYKKPSDQHLRFESLLAIYLKIETGMRLQEIMNLMWSDINVQDRTIEIRVGKTATKRKRGPVIVGMSILAEVFMNALGNKESSYIFSRTENGNDPKIAFNHRFMDIRKRAGIDDLQYRDLRHEAATYIHLATNLEETSVQLGHENTNNTSTYVDEKKGTIPILLNKLDRDFLGMTLNEAGGRKLPNVDWRYVEKRWSNKGYSKIRCWYDKEFKYKRGKHGGFKGNMMFYPSHHLEQFMKYWLTEGNHLAKKQKLL